MNLNRKDYETLAVVKRILETEYRNHYTYDQLAQKVSTNVYKLKHGYKQVYNKSIYAYLTWVRIERAKELLQQTDLLVSVVANMVGIEGISNFNKSFKRYTGVSPSTWRRKNSPYGR